MGLMDAQPPLSAMPAAQTLWVATTLSLTCTTKSRRQVSTGREYSIYAGPSERAAFLSYRRVNSAHRYEGLTESDSHANDPTTKYPSVDGDGRGDQAGSCFTRIRSCPHSRMVRRHQWRYRALLPFSQVW